MAGKTEFTVSGAEEIQKLLLQLPLEYQKKALYNAFKAGAQVVADDARARAPDVLADKIVVGKPRRAHRLNKDSVVVIAVRKGPSRLAHIFEFGTAERRHSDGHRTGRIRPTPFFRPALDSMSEAAIAVVARVTRENIEIIVNQLAKGQKVSLRRKKK